MNCHEVRELFSDYWDLPERDEKRLMADEHIRECASCREEFEIWRESTALIRETIADSARREITVSSLADKVMKRIYESEPWRMPVTERTYSFTYKTRRNLTFVISFCLSLFVFSFLYSLIYHAPQDEGAAESVTFGIQPVAGVSSDSAAAIDNSRLMASIIPQDPFMIKDGLIRSVPDYLLVLSLLGLTCTLLIMNWLSRVRS